MAYTRGRSFPLPGLSPEDFLPMPGSSGVWNWIPGSVHSQPATDDQRMTVYTHRPPPLPALSWHDPQAPCPPQNPQEWQLPPQLQQFIPLRPSPGPPLNFQAPPLPHPQPGIHHRTPVAPFAIPGSSPFSLHPSSSPLSSGVPTRAPLLPSPWEAGMQASLGDWDGQDTHLPLPVQSETRATLATIIPDAQQRRGNETIRTLKVCSC